MFVLKPNITDESIFDYVMEYCMTCGRVMQYHDRVCVLCGSDIPDDHIDDVADDELAAYEADYFKRIELSPVCKLSYYEQYIKE